MPKVSVIIATYNRANYIKDAIDSVLAQTFDDYEIIVVDDGSTDGTRETVATYGDKIRYFYAEHSNQSTALNFGIARATGGYIAFLDDDDLWLPNKLEVQVLILENNSQIGLVSSEVYQVNPDGTVFYHWGRKYHNPLSFDQLFEHNFINHSVAMARKSVIDQVLGFDPTLQTTQDYDLWLRLAKICKIDYVNQPLGKIRFHPGNKHKNRDQKIKDRLYVITKDENMGHMNYFQKRLRIAKEYYMHAEYFKNTESSLSAGKNYFKAILYYPTIGSYCVPENAPNTHLLGLYQIIRPYIQVVYWIGKGLLMKKNKQTKQNECYK